MVYIMISGQKAETGLDKALPYIVVLMVKSDGGAYPKFALPDGYRFAYYKPGMEEAFARLQYAVGGTESLAAAWDIFRQEFGDSLSIVAERMLFAVEKGEAVGTACLWQGNHFGSEMAQLHWVAVHPEHQNKGIAKALLTALLDRCNELGPGEKIYLITQTWSWKAIRLYFKYGFNPYIGPKPALFRADEFENNNSLAWNLIYDKIEAFEAERK